MNPTNSFSYLSHSPSTSLPLFSLEQNSSSSSSSSSPSFAFSPSIAPPTFPLLTQLRTSNKRSHPDPSPDPLEEEEKGEKSNIVEILRRPQPPINIYTWIRNSRRNIPQLSFAEEVHALMCANLPTVFLRPKSLEKCHHYFNIRYHQEFAAVVTESSFSIWNLNRNKRIFSKEIEAENTKILSFEKGWALVKTIGEIFTVNMLNPQEIHSVPLEVFEDPDLRKIDFSDIIYYHPHFFVFPRTDYAASFRENRVIYVVNITDQSISLLDERKCTVDEVAGSENFLVRVDSPCLVVTDLTSPENHSESNINELVKSFNDSSAPSSQIKKKQKILIRSIDKVLLEGSTLYCGGKITNKECHCTIIDLKTKKIQNIYQPFPPSEKKSTIISMVKNNERLYLGNTMGQICAIHLTTDKVDLFGKCSIVGKTNWINLSLHGDFLISQSYKEFNIWDLKTHSLVMQISRNILHPAIRNDSFYYVDNNKFLKTNLLTQNTSKEEKNNE